MEPEFASEDFLFLLLGGGGGRYFSVPSPENAINIRNRNRKVPISVASDLNLGLPLNSPGLLCHLAGTSRTRRATQTSASNRGVYTLGHPSQETNSRTSDCGVAHLTKLWLTL